MSRETMEVEKVANAKMRDSDDKKKLRYEKRQRRKKLKKRALMKQIIRNQRARSKQREKEKLEAALKLQRMQKARANWVKANSMDEEMLMKVRDPLKFLHSLRLQHDSAKHPAFKGYDSKLRQTHSADFVHPCFYWYQNATHVPWINRKNSYGFIKKIDVSEVHPAMPNHSLQSRQVCDVHQMHPSMYLRHLEHKNPLEDALDSDDEEFYKKKAPKTYVDLPKDSLNTRRCPVCDALEGRIGLSGCPGCYKLEYDPKTQLPWLRLPRTLPGVEQGFRVQSVPILKTPPQSAWMREHRMFSVQYEKKVKAMRIRRKRDPPLKKLNETEVFIDAKQPNSKLTFNGAHTSMYGDIEDEDFSWSEWCKHTHLYTRNAIEIHREKHGHRILHITIKSLPDENNVIDLYVDPKSTTTAELNFLVTFNSGDYRIGLCGDGRKQCCVLVIPTEKGFYHIDCRTFPATDLNNIVQTSIGDITLLSELKLRTEPLKPLSEGPDTLAVLRMPILSKIAIPRLCKRYFAANISQLHLDINWEVLEDKMFEVHDYLPGNDPFQKELKAMIFDQIGAKERIHTEEKWKKMQQKKAYIKKLKREEQLQIQKMERAAMRLLQKQEAERIMRKQLKEEREKKRLKAAQKRKEDAAMLKQLLAAAGRSRPSTPTIPKILSDQEKLDIKLLKEEQKRKRALLEQHEKEKRRQEHLDGAATKIQKIVRGWNVRKRQS